MATAAAQGVRRRFPPRLRVQRSRLLLYNAISVTAIIGAWYLLTVTRAIPPLFLPSPGAVAARLHAYATRGYGGSTLSADMKASFARLGMGFGCAIAGGIPLGLAMGLSRRIRDVINPWLQFYRPLPPLAYLGLVILWFGIGNTSQVILLALAGFPPVVIATTSGVWSTRIQRVEGARSLGLSGLALVRYVILPSALPATITGIRVAFGVTYTTLIAAEMVNARSGLGTMILQASDRLDTALVFVGIGVMGLTGWIVDGIIRAFQRRLVPWAPWI